MGLENCVLRENRLDPGMYYAKQTNKNAHKVVHFYRIVDPSKKPVKPLCGVAVAYRKIHSRAYKGRLEDVDELRYDACPKCKEKLERNLSNF